MTIAASPLRSTGGQRSPHRYTARQLPTAHALHPVSGGPVDAFVAKLSADGRSLLYSTYLGGNDEEVGYAVAVAKDGSAYLTGYTRSATFPTLSPLQSASGGHEDAFIARMKADGSALLFSSYLGGSHGDYGQSLAIDGAGDAHIAGYTHSTDFPTLSPLQSANGGHQDAFITKMKADGSALLYSTYLGGSDSDYARSVALDIAAMHTSRLDTSSDFPTVIHCRQPWRQR